MNFTTFDRLTGRIFEIQAGEEPRSFFAHASILSQSETLKALVEGDWKDSVDRIIKLPDWDADTVGRLLEWLYMGDYHGILKPGQQKQADPQDSQSSTGGDTVSVSENSDTEVAAGMCKRKAHPEKSLVPISDQLFDEHQNKKRRYSLMHSNTRKTDCTQELAFDVLSAHAKVYCLANYMLLPGLQALAFITLQELLINMDLYDTPVIRTVIPVVKYVYANTTRPRKGEEPLQRLVTTFIAQNAWSFMWCTDVQQLMEENGEFAADVWTKASMHIGSLRSTIEEMRDELTETRDKLLSRTPNEFTGW